MSQLTFISIMLSQQHFEFDTGFAESSDLECQAVKDIQNIQCDILAQCIEDILMNSKKYHITFMLDVINYGSASDIVAKLKCIDGGFAKRIVFERKRGIFESVFMLSRTGVSRSKINMLLKANV
jgi:hypothetical protein